MEELKLLKTDLQELINNYKSCNGINTIYEQALTQVTELIDSKIESLTLTNINPINNKI